jgi:hypothetical protein
VNLLYLGSLPIKVPVKFLARSGDGRVWVQNLTGYAFRVHRSELRRRQEKPKAKATEGES